MNIAATWLCLMTAKSHLTIIKRLAQSPLQYYTLRWMCVCSHTGLQLCREERELGTILRLGLRRYFRIEENKFGHAMQTYKESRGLSPYSIYNPGTSWRWVVKLTPQHFSPGKEARYPMNRKLGESQVRHGRFRQESKTPNRPACSKNLAFIWNYCDTREDTLWHIHNIFTSHSLYAV